MRIQSLDTRGFTLIEVLIVVVVIGLLATLAIPNYERMIGRSQTSSCISNQRSVCRDAQLWANEVGYGSGVINVGLLQLAGYTNQESSQCPNNTDGSVDDYFITLVNGRVTAISCDILTVEHEFSCPPM